MRTTAAIIIAVCATVACSDAHPEQLLGNWHVRMHLDSLPRPWWETQWQPDTIRLRPPVVSGTVRFTTLSDERFDFVEGTFLIDVTPILDDEPPDNRTRAWFKHDSVTIKLGMRGSDYGELELRGFFVSDSTIAGRWNQIFETHHYEGGAFLMTRAAR